MISLKEAVHILVSVITITLAFTLFPVGSFSINSFWFVLVTVGLAFVLHELAHKFVAMHYGASARYEAFTLGLVFALFLAFASSLFLGYPIIFAAPGAVMIYGKTLSREQTGKIALAGPATNLLLGFVFLLLFFAGFNKELVVYGVLVNVFIGAFNLLPFHPFDGKKIKDWNQKIWLSFFLFFLAALFLAPV
ncbi:MAG: site-2 protease family protein [Candidatus Micrarchaeota archaeon]